jgi:hypothetical protein
MIVFPLFKRTNSASEVLGNFLAIFQKLSPDLTTYFIFCGADWGATGLDATGLAVVDEDAVVVSVEPTGTVPLEALEPSVPTTETGATKAVSTGAAATTGLNHS